MAAVTALRWALGSSPSWHLARPGRSTRAARSVPAATSRSVAPPKSRVASRLRLQARPLAGASLLLDTSVWSLALRRDKPFPCPEVSALAEALGIGGSVFTTGVVLQELLQGFAGPRAHNEIVIRFGVLPFIVPDRQDHIDASAVRNECRKKGITIGTIDALLAQLCIRHNLVMLTTDRDFSRVTRVRPLRVWKHHSGR